MKHKSNYLPLKFLLIWFGEFFSIIFLFTEGEEGPVYLTLSLLIFDCVINKISLKYLYKFINICITQA
jgi:hypothetical protein